MKQALIFYFRMLLDLLEWAGNLGPEIGLKSPRRRSERGEEIQKSPAIRIYIPPLRLPLMMIKVYLDGHDYKSLQFKNKNSKLPIILPLIVKNIFVLLRFMKKMVWPFLWPSKFKLTSDSFTKIESVT